MTGMGLSQQNLARCSLHQNFCYMKQILMYGLGHVFQALNILLESRSRVGDIAHINFIINSNSEPRHVITYYSYDYRSMKI